MKDIGIKHSRRTFMSLLVAPFLTLPPYTKSTSPMKSCLFVVDVQKGFISSQTAHVQDRITDLLGQNCFNHTIFTKFVNTQDSPYVRYLGWDRLIRAEEQDLVDSLKPFAHIVFEKKAYTAINNQSLNFLAEHKVQVAFVLGIDTDCCVLSTAIDLFKIGIRPYVLAHYSASNGGQLSHDSAIVVLKRLIGRNAIISEPVNQDIISGYTSGVASDPRIEYSKASS